MQILSGSNKNLPAPSCYQLHLSWEAFMQKICCHTEWQINQHIGPAIILSMGSANERRRYTVTSSLIGWAHNEWSLRAYHSSRLCQILSDDHVFQVWVHLSLWLHTDFISPMIHKIWILRHQQHEKYCTNKLAKHFHNLSRLGQTSCYKSVIITCMMIPFAHSFQVTSSLHTYVPSAAHLMCRSPFLRCQRRCPRTRPDPPWSRQQYLLFPLRKF